MADKVYYTDLMEYANDASAQLAWVTNASTLELDYMEYANDGAAQAAYVSSDATPVESITENYEVGADTESPISGVGGVNEKWSMEFQHSNSFDCSKVSIYLSRSNNPTDNIVVRIETDSAGLPSGTLVNVNATQLMAASGISVYNTFNWYTFTFPSTFALSANTKYHLVVQRSGARDTTNVIWWRVKDVGTYANGGGERQNSGSWVESGQDPYFRVYKKVIPLQSYSESTIKNQGSYSLKGIAAITNSLNDTLTKSGLSIDLSNKNTLKFDCYASRTGTNLQMQIHDSGGQTSTKDIVISSANTWETTTWDISGVADANKDNIDSIIITIVNADAANTFYIDNFRAPSDLQCYSEATIIRQGTYSLKINASITGALNKTLTKTLTDYLDYSIMDVIKFDIRASRTGSNIKFKIHDTGGTTSEHTVNIVNANTWQIEEWDISAITTTDRDTIDKLIIEITNAGALNTIYIDNLYSKINIPYRTDIDLMEYANNANAQLAYVTSMSALELDYMEYANDGAAQTAYVSSDGDAVPTSEYSSDANTQLLLHCNGSDASTTIPDSGNTNHGNATVSGNAQLDTAQKKFGTASLLLDGNDDYIYYVDHNDWDLGSGNFTIDTWVRFTVVNGIIVEHYRNTNGQRGWKVGVSGPGEKIFFMYSTDGNTDTTVNFTGVPLNTGQWYHIAIVRNGNNLNAYLDGVSKGSTHDMTGVTIYDGGQSLWIGADNNNDTPVQEVNGWIDDPRISKGIARWTSDFDTANLQSYSESTIKNQGSYSLKGVALITDSLNDTLTKSGLSIDLSNKNTLKFDCYASRTGTNLQMQIHDSGGTTSTKDIVISSADTWTEITWDISGISNANKDNIDSIIIKIINADSANTFYIDNFFSPILLQSYSESAIKVQGSYSLKVDADKGCLNETLTKTFTCPLDLSIVAKIIGRVRASRTGTNFQLRFRDSNLNWQSKNIAINSANTWETIEWDLASIIDTDRDVVDRLQIKITNADADNLVYMDNFYGVQRICRSYVWMG